jgi:tetratricopeptide (TPR) repeat protein
VTGRAARRPAGRRRLLIAGGAALLLAVLVQGTIDTRAASRTAASPLLYLPSGRYLDIAALGFDGVLADLIYLWSIQYYGNYAIADRYLYLDHIYRRVIAEIDPHYIDPYVIGALIMNVEAHEPEMALRLLDTGIAHNPGRWILAFEAGFICYDTLKDYPRAARYFETALAAPDVHPLVRRLHAAMVDRSGDRRAALRLWAGIHDTTDDAYTRRVAWNHVHDLKVEIDLADLRAALAAFAARHGAPPRRIEALTAGGFLPRIPVDPEDRPYRYDPVSGTVDYAGVPVVGR